MSSERRDQALESPERHESRRWVAAEPEQSPQDDQPSSEEGTLKTFLRRLGMVGWLSPRWPGP